MIAEQSACSRAYKTHVLKESVGDLARHSRLFRDKKIEKMGSNGVRREYPSKKSFIKKVILTIIFYFKTMKTGYVQQNRSVFLSSLMQFRFYLFQSIHAS